jgi:hypothetical protein
VTVYRTHGEINAEECCLGDMKERDHLQDLTVNGRGMLKRNINGYDNSKRTGIDWLRTGSRHIRALLPNLYEINRYTLCVRGKSINL